MVDEGKSKKRRNCGRMHSVKSKREVKKAKLVGDCNVLKAKKEEDKD
jgi:hypothetical protein